MAHRSKRKLAIVGVGVFLLAGITFGISNVNRDNLKSDSFWSRSRGFVCSEKTLAPKSRETREYNRNLLESQRLQTRRDKLRLDTNVFENTCKNLKGRKQAKCREDVAELRTINRRLEKLTTEINAYQDCKINSYPRPTVVVDNQVASVYNNWDLVTLGSFTVSAIEKGHNIPVTAVPFQILDSNARGKFLDIQITDGIKSYPCRYFDANKSMIECDNLDFDAIKSQTSKTFQLKSRLWSDSKIWDKYSLMLVGLWFNNGTIPINPLIDPVKNIMNMEVTTNDSTSDISVKVWEGENEYVSSSGDMFTHLQSFSVKSSQNNILIKSVKLRIIGDRTIKSVAISTPLWMVPQDVENNYVIFKDLNLFVPKGQEWINIALAPMYSEISSTTIPSGTRSTIVLDSLDYSLKTNNQNNTITPNTYWRTMIVVGSVPLVTFIPNTSLDKIIWDTARILQFTISTYSGDIILKELPLYIENVWAEDSKANSIIVKDNNTWEIIPTENNQYGFGKSVILKFINWYKVPAASSQSLSIYVPISWATQWPIITKLLNENFVNLIWRDWSFDTVWERWWLEGAYLSGYPNDFVSTSSR